MQPRPAEAREGGATRRIVLITGASDGIGAALARLWAEREGAGLALAICGRDERRLAAVAEACRAHGAEVLARRADIGQRDECRALVEATVQAYGALDVLVNNAGMASHALFTDTPDLGWPEQLMRVNHWGSVWCTQAALPALLARRGRLVAVSSLAGLVGLPWRSSYCASKFAMTGFFESLRAEVAPQGLSVTIAYPGVVDTRIRERSFDAQGRPAGPGSRSERHAISAEACAEHILRGTLARRREVFMDTRSRLARWARLMAPGLLDRFARHALTRDTKTP